MEARTVARSQTPWTKKDIPAFPGAANSRLARQADHYRAPEGSALFSFMPNAVERMALRVPIFARAAG